MSERFTLTVRNVDLNSDVAVPGPNTFEVRLANTSGRALSLSPLAAGGGVPALEDLDGADASAVVLRLSGFGGDERGVIVSGEGWTARAFGQAKRDWRFGLAPTAAATLNPGNALVFRVAGVEVAGPPAGQARIGVDYYNVGDESGSTKDAGVTVQASGPQPLPPYDVSVVPGADTVYVSEHGLDPILNTIEVVLSNRSAPPVPGHQGGVDSLDAGDAVFYLSLLFAEDAADERTASALTTRRYAAGVLKDDQPIQARTDSDWTPQPVHFDDDRPVFPFTVRPGRLLGGQQKSVRFTIENIQVPYGEPLRASFEPGEMTYLFVQYDRVPGYGSGSLPPVKIWKRAATPALTRFDIQPSAVHAGEPVRVFFETTAVDYVTLNGQRLTHPDGRPLRNCTEGYVVRPQTNTTQASYTLCAYDKHGKAAAASPRSMPIDVTPLPPRIDAFSLSPRVVKGAPGTRVDLDLSWVVADAAAEVTISPSVDRVSIAGDKRLDGVSVPAAFTLTAQREAPGGGFIKSTATSRVVTYQVRTASITKGIGIGWPRYLTPDGRTLFVGSGRSLFVINTDDPQGFIKVLELPGQPDRLWPSAGKAGTLYLRINTTPSADSSHETFVIYELDATQPSSAKKLGDEVSPDNFDSQPMDARVQSQWVGDDMQPRPSIEGLVAGLIQINSSRGVLFPCDPATSVWIVDCYYP